MRPFHVRWVLGAFKAVWPTAGGWLPLLVSGLIGAVLAFISPQPPGQDATSALLAWMGRFLLATLIVLSGLFLVHLFLVPRRMEQEAKRIADEELSNVKGELVLARLKVQALTEAAAEHNRADHNRPLVRLVPHASDWGAHGHFVADLTVQTDDQRPIVNAQGQVIAMSHGSTDEMNVEMSLPWSNPDQPDPKKKTFSGTASLRVATGGDKAMDFGSERKREMFLPGRPAASHMELEKDVDHFLKIQVSADNIDVTVGWFKLSWSEIGKDKGASVRFVEAETVQSNGRSRPGQPRLRAGASAPGQVTRRLKRAR
jgi:hypothetical protein